MMIYDLFLNYLSYWWLLSPLKEVLVVEINTVKLITPIRCGESKIYSQPRDYY